MTTQPTGSQLSGRNAGWGSVAKVKRKYGYVYYVRYPDPSYTGAGRKPRISLGKTFSKEWQAKAALAEVRRSIFNETWRHPDEIQKEEEASARERKREAYTLGEWARQWLREVDAGDYKANTRRDYHSIYKNHIQPYWEDVPLRSVTHDDTRQWYEDLISKYGKSVQTRARAYRVWSVMIHAALDAGKIDNTAPFMIKNARGKSRTKKQESPRVATPQEVRCMLSHAIPFVQTAIILAYDCGLRYQEIAALTRKNIILTGDDPRVRIVQAVGGKGTPVIEAPKSEASRREVPIPEYRLPWLREYLQTYVAADQDALIIQAPRSSYNSIVKNDHLHRGKGRFNEVRDLAGLPKSFTFHDLRRSYATQLGQQGATFAELMRLLGHSDPKTVMIYQVAEKDRLRMLVQRRGEYMAGQEEGSVLPLAL